MMMQHKLQDTVHDMLELAHADLDKWAYCLFPCFQAFSAVRMVDSNISFTNDVLRANIVINFEEDEMSKTCLENKKGCWEAHETLAQWISLSIRARLEDFLHESGAYKPENVTYTSSARMEDDAMHIMDVVVSATSTAPPSPEWQAFITSHDPTPPPTSKKEELESAMSNVTIDEPGALVSA